MRKKIVLTMTMLAVACVAKAQGMIDVWKEASLQEVQVTSLRATSTTPVAYSNMNREMIDAVNYGQDIPFLLSTLPSITTTTDAGNGIGYTSIRVRGTDASRINVTANGIPLNDSESSHIYFSDFGDFASSVQSIQVQRGVGTSTNGSGAFGASINMMTEGISMTPYAGLDVSGGSYGTHKETVRFSTGLMNGHFGIQGRLSNIGSNGYVDRATSSLNSYFLQAGYYTESTSLKFITFNGTEKTYMAWNYTSKGEQSLYGRRFNSCGLYYDKDGNMKFYDDQYDTYHQQHYQLHWNQWLSSEWTMNAALHYTHDNYYYDQMKTGKKLYSYLLTDDTKMRADLVQRKDGDKDFYGVVAAVNYSNNEGLSANFGGALNHFDASHLGHVMWVGTPYYKDAPNVALPLFGLEPNYKYYGNDSRKTDGNIYAKVNWEFAKGLNAYADLQYRHVNYQMDGRSDDWDDNGQINYDLNRNFDFFNPKAGLNYNIDRHHRVYASYAIAHREPTRDHFQEQWGTPIKAERLNDLEVGYKYRERRFAAGINLYWMDYKNQFVLTGELNDEGEAITKNIDKSYRMGVELEAAWTPTKWLRWDANATLSKNRAKDMIITLDDYTTQVNVGETPLSFSPEVIINNIFTFNHKGWSASIQSQYVGEQYLTNYGVKTMRCWTDWSMTDDVATNETLMLGDHFTTNIDLSYRFKIKEWGLKNARVGVTIYNLFSAKYDNNGWAAPQFRQDANGKVYAVNTWGLRDQEAAGFAPSAPFNMMAHLSLSF